MKMVYFLQNTMHFFVTLMSLCWWHKLF